MSQVRIGQVGPAKAGLQELGHAQVALLQHGVLEAGGAEPATAEVRPGQVRAAEIGLLELGPVPQLRFDKRGPLKVGPAAIQLPGEMNAVQTDPAQIDFAERPGVDLLLVGPGVPAIDAGRSATQFLHHPGQAVLLSGFVGLCLTLDPVCFGSRPAARLTPRLQNQLPQWLRFQRRTGRCHLDRIQTQCPVQQGPDHGKHCLRRSPERRGCGEREFVAAEKQLLAVVLADDLHGDRDVARQGDGRGCLQASGLAGDLVQLLEMLAGPGHGLSPGHTLGLAQVEPRPFRSGQVGSLEIGPFDPGVGQVRVGQDGTAQTGVAQVGPFQVRLEQVGLGEVRLVQVGPGKVAVLEIGSRQISLGQVGAGKVGLAGGDPFQVSALEDDLGGPGFFQRGFLQVGPGEIGAFEDRIEKACLPQVGADEPAIEQSLEGTLLKLGPVQVNSGEDAIQADVGELDLAQVSPVEVEVEEPVLFSFSPRRSLPDRSTGALLHRVSNFHRSYPFGPARSRARARLRSGTTRAKNSSRERTRMAACPAWFHSSACFWD